MAAILADQLPQIAVREQRKSVPKSVPKPAKVSLMFGNVR